MTPITQVDIVHAHLRMRSGEVVPFATLMRALWGDATNRYARDHLAALVAKVRKIIPPGYVIDAQRGRGYVMRIPERRDMVPLAEPARVVKPEPVAPKPKAKKSRPDHLKRWREELAAEAAKRAQPKQRRCLWCDATFASSGPGNRCCEKCQHRRREHAEDYSLVGIR